MVPILAALASSGLNLLVGAIQAKGKEVVEKQLGVKIPDSPEQLTPELTLKLKELEAQHEEFLVNAQIQQAQMEYEADAKGQQQITDRWKSDMMSDSWLSKNIRPVILLYLTIFVTLSSLVSKWLEMRPDFVSMLADGWYIVLSAYFVGRSIQHGVRLWKGKGQ